MEQVQKDPERIAKMFSKISGSYDLTNDVLSLGTHRLWKKRLVQWAEVKANEKVLDGATGTGDLAILFSKMVGPLSEVTAVDFCDEMMSHGPGKAQKAGAKVKFLHADLLDLPFEPETFDVMSIAFGIRNVANVGKALSQAHRVLKENGRLLILEFGPPPPGWFQKAYSLYSKYGLPLLGGLLTGDSKAYRYLEESSAHFPVREQFVQEALTAAPWKVAEHQSLSGGLACLYRFRK